MNAYVNDYSDKLDIKSSRNGIEKKKLKLNIGKIKDVTTVRNDRLQEEIDELKKENIWILDR